MKPPVTVERSEWDEVLDRLEAALVTGDDYEPPADLPVLPQRLLPRARAIQARQDEVVAELIAERDRVGAELAAQRRTTRAPGVTAATGASLAL